MTPREETLKMFVWTGVLSDYTSGMVCVLAHSKEEAYDIVRKTESLSDSSKGEILAMEPETVSKPSLVCVYGGG